ncbi:MAG: glycosyltransferase [Alphaproteobacteria bacterium]|nr:glycosyltransferase [Alphaproteobacteria bacterium]
MANDIASDEPAPRPATVTAEADNPGAAELSSLLDEVRGSQRRARRRIGELEADAEAKTLRIRSLEQALGEVHDRERALREQIDHLRDDLRRERSAALAAMRQAEAATRTISFRLGRAFLDASNSLSGAVALPGKILSLHRETKKREKVRGPGYVAEIDADIDRRPLLDQLQAGGIAAARAWIDETATGDDRRRAGLLSELSRLAGPLDPKGALAAAEDAYECDARPFRAKWLAMQLARQGAIDRPMALLEGLPVEELGRLKPSERLQFARLRGLHRLKHLPSPVPGRARRTPAAEPKRVFYIAASALPDHVSGYTRRSHALVRFARAEGWAVELLTRPGYPGDRTDRVDDPVALTIDLQGVVPERLPGPSIATTPIDEWIEAAAGAIAARARRGRPAVIHAASNWLNGLPALIAARRLGLPFIYEVRGFWELTRAARQPAWDQSEEHALAARFEASIAGEADRVVTHSERLAQELVRRGIERSRIAIVPNGAELPPVADRPDPAARAAFGLPRDRFALGYAGSVVDYEGLDDLVQAVHLLVQDGLDVEAIIAGDGNARGMLASLVAQLGLADRVKLAGVIPPDQAVKLFAAVDAVALPRKSFAVTELVEPLKPFEAMAAGRPVVASDIAPLREIIRPGETGLLHRPSDPDDLAAQLRRLVHEPELARALGRAGRRYVEAEHAWPVSARREVETWEQVLAESAQRPGPSSVAPRASRKADGFGGTGGRRAPPAALVESLSLPRRQNRFAPEQRRAFIERAEAALRSGGLDAVLDLVRRQARGRPASFGGLCLVLAAQAARQGELFGEELDLLERAVDTAPGAMSWRALARALWYRGDVERARFYLEQVERGEGAAPRPETQKLRILVDQRARLVALGDDLLRHYGEMGEPLAQTDRGKAVYLLHFTLPYASNGYATRSQGLLQAMRASGFDVVAYSRSGFPYDMPAFREASGLAEADVIDGVVYRRIFAGSRVEEPELDYILNSAARYEAALRKERPALVHAASNFTTGLPALIAARRLGLPFIYEARGFWEMTRASRQADFERHPQYRLMQSLESLVAREADRVITLTDAMRDDLIARGAAPDRVSVVANAVDAERFRPLLRDTALAERLRLPPGVPVIGYVGSIVGYEGLDDLVEACAGLRADGHDFRLLLVGDGAALPALRGAIRAGGLEDRVAAPGRVAFEEVEAYYSLIDICPFPRKPMPICELVSPLKPFEALAMEKAVIVSSVRPLAEIVADRETGLVFRKGEPADLQRALGELLGDAELRRRLGEAGRRWVAANRSWDAAGQSVLALYRELIDSRAP